MNKKQSYFLLGAVLIVIITIVLLFILHFKPVDKNILTVTFLNVGQGDAIFIEAPNKKQILVDGGGDGTILRELGSVMPFYDRSIDIVIATHPDKDHIGGLVDVVQNFSVDQVVRSGVESDTSTFKLFDSLISRQNIIEHTAERGMRIYLDEELGIYIDVLHPAYDVSRVQDKNDASVILRLVYGETEFLLTGDASKRIEKELITKGDAVEIRSDVLKLGHHGSKTSSDLEFLQAVQPELAIVSASCDNRYGHPHSEVTDRVKKLGIAIMETCIDNRISLKSDGINIVIY